MKIDILTLFPEMFDGFKSESIIKRAIDNKKVEINTCNFRTFSKDKHNKVDDTPYGGGAGMVLMCQPIFDAVESLRTEKSKVILLSPQGKKYNQKKAYELSNEEHLIFICGHYEGFDERIKTICDEEISIGDYVLTGGELPAMILTDSIVRLLPGVIQEESCTNESFNGNLLDYPTYTKPREYKGMKVPEVLLSGNHKKIDDWRKSEQVRITKEKRPDLVESKYSLIKQGIKKNVRKITIDDVKNIKVTEIKEKENKKYKVEKTYELIAITIFNPKNLHGYKLKGKSSDSLTKILIVKKEFYTKVAFKNVSKKINILSQRLKLALNDKNNDYTTKVLSEAQILKDTIIACYSSYLSSTALNEVINKIDYLVNEFVKIKTTNL